jgi:hypothetical protein
MLAEEHATEEEDVQDNVKHGPRDIETVAEWSYAPKFSP